MRMTYILKGLGELFNPKKIYMSLFNVKDIEIGVQE